MKIIIRSFILVFLLYTCESKIKSEKVANHDSLDSIATDLDSLIPFWQKDLNIPNVAVGIIHNGKVYKTSVYGTLNGKKAPKDMLFNIASITKVVFGSTVMKLVQNGSWDLDEPLFQYYIDPDVKNDPNHKLLTSRHVLSQQSGFVNWRWNHPTEKLTFDFKPGTKFNYSGEGMEYLRKAIESKFNLSWEDIADSLLFKPMNLKNTSHSWDGESNFERFSKFYDTDGKEHLLEDHSFEVSAADDIMTTIDDLTLFGTQIMDGSYLAEATSKEMMTKQIAINANQDQALGWRRIDQLNNDEYAIHHGGNDIGVAALIVLLPKSKRGVVVLTNGDAGIVMCNNIVRKVFAEGKEIIHRAYRSNSMDEIPQAIKISEDLLDAYVGTYEQPSGRRIEISKSGEGLLMKMAGVPNFQLYPESDRLFFLMDFDPKIEFEKTNTGDLVLKILEGENTIICKRVP